MYLSSSLSMLTRSNWKFCSSTRVRGSLSDANVTVVGSMSAATSVNFTVERPFSSCRVAIVANHRVARHRHGVRHARARNRPIEFRRNRPGFRGTINGDGGFVAALPLPRQLRSSTAGDRDGADTPRTNSLHEPWSRRPFVVTSRGPYENETRSARTKLRVVIDMSHPTVRPASRFADTESTAFTSRSVSRTPRWRPADVAGYAQSRAITGGRPTKPRVLKLWKLRPSLPSNL